LKEFQKGDKILVVGDLHVGSNVSIMPDEVCIGEGERSNKIKSNPLQKFIFAQWRHMVGTIGKVDACIVLGDSVEGSNRKSKGSGLWTSDMSTQIRVASDLLKMVKTNTYIGVQGSYYHVEDNVSSDKAVIDALGGNFGDELVVVNGKTRIHCSHAVGVSSSATAYRPTPIAREMMLATINKEEYGKYDLILRGHAHYYVEVRFGSSKGIICPCWKGRDEYVARKTLAFLPHLGYILLQGKDVYPYVFTLDQKFSVPEVHI
jgi:predicted phosphodiesterase